MINVLNNDAGHPAQSHSMIGVFVGRCKLGSLQGPSFKISKKNPTKQTKTIAVGIHSKYSVDSSADLFISRWGGGVLQFFLHT